MTSKNASTVTTSSSSIKLNPGCHKLKTKTRHLSLIPLIDLTEDVENIHQVNNENLIVGISNGNQKIISILHFKYYVVYNYKIHWYFIQRFYFIEYLDHGDQVVVCQTCRAKLWRNESIRGKEKGNTDYSLCCVYGKVQLPDLKKPPPTYERMFRNMDSKSKHFMKNIRCYNSMFFLRRWVVKLILQSIEETLHTFSDWVVKIIIVLEVFCQQKDRNQNSLSYTFMTLTTKLQIDKDVFGIFSNFFS